MQGQYNIATHTILPLVYRILGPANHISYLLREPATQSLFLFNPIANIKANKQYSEETEKKYYSWLMEHILNIEKSSASKLTHIFCNHGMLRTQYSKLMEKLSSEDRFKNTKCVLPDSSNNNKFNTIKPEVIGELSVCFIGAEGYFDDYNLIGVTHISPTSTKIPVLFVNDLLGVSRIDFEYEQAYKLKGDRSSSLMKTLDKVKYFPNQTYIFPSHIAKKTDLLFAKAIFEQQPSSSKSLTLLLQKIKLFDANSEKSPDCLIPTTLLQEKIMNPFLFPERYYQMLGLKNKDKQKCFSLLRGMRKQWSKSSSMQK